MWNHTSNSSIHHDLISSDGFPVADDFQNDDSIEVVINTNPLLSMMMAQHHGNGNTPGSIHRSIGARHVFLHSKDYSLFKKQERLIWQLNHLHANVNQLLQTSIPSPSAASPTSPSLNGSKNIQVLSASMKKHRELSMRRNRFLKVNINESSHDTTPLNVTLEFDASKTSAQNSPTAISDESPMYNYEQVRNMRNLSIPRSLSIDQLQQASSNAIVRSMSIDQIHYNGSNPSGGVVILPPHLYGASPSNSPKTGSHYHVDSMTSIETISSTSTEEITCDDPNSAMELLPNTHVHTIYSKYSLVLTIDLSPSMLAMDPITGEVIFDRIYVTICNLLRRLTQPMSIPFYNGDLIPELHVTGLVIGMVGRPVFCLFQDYHITQNNLVESLGKIYQSVCDVENMAAAALKNSTFKNWNENSNFKFNNYVVNSLMAFDFLPKDSCPVFLLISDSVFSLSDINSDVILTINQKDISFGVINITNHSSAGYLYSYVPDSELIESFVTCVDGVYMEHEYLQAADVESVDKQRTSYIQAALFIRNSPLFILENENLVIASSEGGVFSNVQRQKDLKKSFYEVDILNYALNMTSVDSLLKIRTKQGFKILDIKYAKNTDSLSKFKVDNDKLDVKTVKLSLLYRRNIEVIYKLQIDRIEISDDQDILTSNFSSFGIPKMKNFKVSVSISVYMHKSNQDRFKTFLKKRTKESLFKLLQDYIQNLNIEDVLIEQYHNLSESCSGTNKSSIRKMDLSNVNFDQEKEVLFEGQTLTLNFPEEQPGKSEPIIQSILSQLQSGGSSSELVPVQTNIMLLRSFCEKNWCTTKVSDDTFILFVSEQDCTSYLCDTLYDTSLLTMEEKDNCFSSGFCLLRLSSISSSIIPIQFQFFNVSSFTIRRIVNQFKEKLLSGFTKKHIRARFYQSDSFNDITERLPKCKEDETQYSLSLYNQAPHYTSYLKHKNWTWPLGGRLNVAGILSSIFSQRISESFSLVYSNQSVIFSKEIDILKFNRTTNMEYTTKAILLYCIHILRKEKKLITEVWIEPQSGYVLYSNGSQIDASVFCNDMCDNWFHNLDMQVISLFSTFESVVSACKSGKGSNNISLFNPERMTLSTPFNLKGIFDRSHKIKLEFDVYKFLLNTDADSENSKKNNLALYDRLMKLLSNVNDVEINIEKVPLLMETKARCFARVFETVGSERQKDFLLTLVPIQVTGEEKEFSIVICECNEEQLLCVDQLKLNENMKQILYLNNGTPRHSVHSDEKETLSSVDTYCDFVNNLHGYSYTYGVYKYLNQKLSIDLESVVSAIESCYEYREEIDLTEFFEAILLARNYFFEKDENGVSPCVTMVSNFKTIVEKYFDEIRGTNYHYFLREASIPKSNKGTTSNKQLKKKSSTKSFDHLEEIESEDNFEEEYSDTESHYVSEEEENRSVSSFSGRMDLTHQSDHASDSLTESSSSSFIGDNIFSAELENATIPVFMRMECVLTPIEKDASDWDDMEAFSDRMTSYGSDLKLPIKSLPIEKISRSIMSSNGDVSKIFSNFSTEKEEDDDSEDDTTSEFSKQNITHLNSEVDLNWINSLNSVKTMLRFYCITLPPDKHFAAVNGFEPSKKDVLLMFRNHVTEGQFAYAKSKFDPDEFSTDDEIGTDDAAPYLDKNYLPRHIKRIISRTNKRIQALVSKEILNALLKTNPITSYSIKKLFDNVERLPPSCYQKHTIPLLFIDQSEGPKMFHQEIVKCKSLIFKNIENHYVVYFRKRNCCSKHAVFEDYDKKCDQETPIDANKYHLYYKELDDLEMIMFDDDTEMDRTCLELPFWIVLKMDSKKSMSMLFYSPTTLSVKQASDVVNLVLKAVNVVTKRVNTLILLNNLHDTRVCSSLMLPTRTEKDKKALHSEVNMLDKKFLRKASEKPNPEKFEEGSLACKKTHEIVFPLHSRLTTAMAINHLNQAVFNPFVVANRSEMFVYKERSGRVFYLQISDGNKQNDTPSSPRTPPMNTSAEQDPEYKTKLKEYSISLSSMGQYLYAELDIGKRTSSVVLEVYGVFSPSVEITAQLRNLIEGKLSALTMNIISNLLLRNRQFKLTVEDLEFIRPFLQRPNKSIFISIPKFITNRLLFMLFIRNNMLTYMNQLYLSSSDESTENSSNSYMSFTEDEDEDDMVFKALDFSFLYNSVTQNNYSRAMTSTVNCRGISCVQMTLLNQDGDMVTVFPTVKDPFICDLTGVSQLNLLQAEPANITYTDFGAPILKKEGSNSDSDSEEEEVVKENHEHLRSENGKILFEVWKKGDVEIESLLEKIVLTVNQSLTDYIIECGLFNYPVNLEGFNRQFLVRLQTQAIKASRISSPTLMEHRAALFLPLWEMNRFIGDLTNLLSAYSFKFNPITLVSTDSRQSFVQYSKKDDFIEKYHLVDSNNVCFVMLAGNFFVKGDKLLNLGENIKIGDIIGLEGFSHRSSFKYSRKCSLVILLTSAEVQVIAYNWKMPQFEKFKYHLHQTVSWLRCRAHLLNSILHQKLGLFCHSHSSNLVSLPNNPLIPNGKPQKEVQFAFNNIDLLIHNKQNAPVDPKTVLRRSNTQTGTSQQQISQTSTSQPQARPSDISRTQSYNRFKSPQTPTQIALPSSVETKPEATKLLKKEKKVKTSNQFGSLLKGIYDLDKNPGKSLSRRIALDSKRDPLLVHGLHFKHIVHQNYKKKAEQQQVSKIYGVWNKSQSTSLKSKDFQLIKNTSRLLHFCRVPLLFNPLRRILFTPSFTSSTSCAVIQQMDLDNASLSDNQSNNNNLREIGYHRKVFESFLSEYVEYIKSLDISDVFLYPSDQQDGTSPMPHGNSSDSTIVIDREKSSNNRQPMPLVEVVGNQIIKLHPTTIYFQKQMDDGILFLELGLDSIYVYLNVYISDVVTKRPSPMNSFSSTRGDFLKKVSQFKHSLHMNSFSYDFHLRNFLNYLTTDYSGYPTSLSFISLLKDFNQFYSKPPPHTRNILYSHNIVFENVKDISEIIREKAQTPKGAIKSMDRKRSHSLERQEMLQDPFQFFFDYICKNSEKYNVKFSQKSKECFILDTYISHDEADYSYCVLVTKSVDNMNSHMANNISTPVSTSPSDESDFSSSMSLVMYIVFVDATNRHPYDSEVEGSKENMMKIVSQMAQQYERKLLNLLSCVKNSFKLEILWEMAMQFKMSEFLFNELDSLWVKTPLSEFDFTLSIFEANYVPWNDVISELWNIYGGEKAGSIFKKDGSLQHLLILPDGIDCDYLLHVQYDIIENSISLFFCKKRLIQEPELVLESKNTGRNSSVSPKIEMVFNPKLPSDTEREFMSSFINNVCYILYRISFASN